MPMQTKHDFHKTIIGRSELLSFVDYGLTEVPAKTDTGAYRSAVHAVNISEHEGKLSFDLLGGHPAVDGPATRIETEEFNVVTIANSFGHKEERYEVKLRVKLSSKIFTTTFSLADRSKKVYPILLGRILLNHRFLVDPAESSIDRAELKRRFGIVEFLEEDSENKV